MAEWYTRTTQGGFITADEIQAGAVIASKVGTGAITSEKASTNLVSRSIVTHTGVPTTCGTGLLSTGYVVWKSMVPVTITSVDIVPLATWYAASTSAGAIEVWSCTAGRIGAFCASATAFTVAGVVGNRIPLTLSAVTIAACEAVMVDVTATTCAAVPAHQIIVNYYTSA